MAKSVSIDMRRVSAILRRVEYNISAAGLAGYMQASAEPWLAKRARDRFKSNGDSASGSWPPLAASTIEIRQNLGYVPIKTNVRTGLMRDWITNPTSRIRADALGTTMEFPGPMSAKLTQRLAQAAGRRRGPARYILAYDETDLMHLLNSMEAWVMSSRGR